MEVIKVLIVDDELGMCKGAQKALQNFSTKVEEVSKEVHFESEYVTSGKELLHKLQTPIQMIDNPYSLFLLDYKLPDALGLDLLPKIKEWNPYAVVIMITAYATFETAVQATKLGAYDFIPKPFTPEELRISVKKAATRLILTKEAKKFEEEKKRIRFQFISVLSHELKAPLNAIEGYLAILGKRYNQLSEEDYNKMLSRSKLRLDDMRKLIFDLLDMTRIESGEKKRNLESYNLVDLAKKSLELFEEAAKEKNVTITFSSSKEEILYNCDRVEMDIIFNNLFSNGIKYNIDGGKLDISLTQNNSDEIILNVNDTGIGISKEDQEKLFKEFSRIKNEKTIHIGGSGLGLSTVKKIVELNKGEINLQSEFGKGTQIVVKFKETKNLRSS